MWADVAVFPPKPEKTKTSIRLLRSLLDRIDVIAADEGRSRNAAIVLLLGMGIATYETAKRRGITIPRAEEDDD